MALPTNEYAAKYLSDVLASGDWPRTYVRHFARLIDQEPWPHMVHYVGGRVIYTTPDQFCILRPCGPSDCIWIVPGTGQ